MNISTDHAKYLHEYAIAGIPIITSSGTLEKIKINSSASYSGKSYVFGGFEIIPFDLTHNCNEPFGFLINHEESGKILFATDTEYIKYRFKDLSHVLIEANYSNELMQKSSANRDHVLTGHMEIGTTVEFLKETVSSGKNEDLQNVVLIHLSDKNSNEEDFKKQVSNVVSCPVYVADKGMEIEFRKEVY